MPNTPGLGLPNERHYSAGGAEGEGVVTDLVTGLEWQQGVPDESFTFTEAASYCAGLELGGEGGFRVPTRIELVSLLELSRAEPSIDVSAFPGTPGDWFWSSSTSAGDPTRAYHAYFYFGYPDLEDRTSALRVRCVRSPGGERPRATAYDRRADTARDPFTGLTWQRGTADTPLTQGDADEYCADLVLDGHDDFRLPTMPELETLVDESVRAPAIDRVTFPETPALPFWTASSWAGSSDLAWYVSFDYGAALYDLVSAPFQTRCVR